MKKQMRTGRMLNRFGAACALAMLASLMMIPAGQAVAKKTDPHIYVSGTVSFTATDAPPGHGTVFPVTVSGSVAFNKIFLPKGAPALSKKLRAKARKSCLSGLVIPVNVSDRNGGDSQAFDGIATTDAAGNFSVTIQFNSVRPGGFQTTLGYSAGIGFGTKPLSPRFGPTSNKRFAGGRRLRCNAPYPEFEANMSDHSY